MWISKRPFGGLVLVGGGLFGANLLLTALLGLLSGVCCAARAGRGLDPTAAGRARNER